MFLLNYNYLKIQKLRRFERTPCVGKSDDGHSIRHTVHQYLTYIDGYSDRPMRMLTLDRLFLKFLWPIVQ